LLNRKNSFQSLINSQVLKQIKSVRLKTRKQNLKDNLSRRKETIKNILSKNGNKISLIDNPLSIKSTKKNYGFHFPLSKGFYEINKSQEDINHYNSLFKSATKNIKGGQLKKQYLNFGNWKVNKIKFMQNSNSREEIIPFHNIYQEKEIKYNPLNKNIILNHQNGIIQLPKKLLFENHKNSIQPVKIPQMNNGKMRLDYDFDNQRIRKNEFRKDAFKTVENDSNEEKNLGKNVKMIYKIYKPNAKNQQYKNSGNKNKTFVNTPHNARSLDRLIKEVNKSEESENEDNLTVIEKDCENDYSNIYNCLYNYSPFSLHNN